MDIVLVLQSCVGIKIFLMIFEISFLFNFQSLQNCLLFIIVINFKYFE